MEVKKGHWRRDIDKERLTITTNLSEIWEGSINRIRMGKSGPLERARLANHIQGFRIPDHWEPGEKNKYVFFIKSGVKMAGYKAIFFMVFIDRDKVALDP